MTTAEIIKDWLQPGIIVVVGIAILGFLGRLSTRIGNVEKELFGVQKDVANLKDEITNVKEDIKDVRADVRILMQTAAFSSNSPLQLTPRGREVVEMVGGRELINKNKDLLFGAIKAKTSDNEDKFSIQVVAREVIEKNILELLDKETKRKLGADGVDLPLLGKSLSILLRDMYLEQ
jgi:hypothetical protein